MTPPPWFRRSANVSYAVDGSLTVIAVNPVYERAALRDADPGFLERYGVGCRVMTVVPNVLRQRYSSLFSRALDGEMVEQRYQCHTTLQYREFVMRFIPTPERTVVVEHALAMDRPLEAAPLDEAQIAARYERRGVIVICSHCRKARRNDGSDEWEWVPQLLARGRMDLSHGLCAACLGHFYLTGA